MNKNWLYSSRHLIMNGGPHSKPDLDFVYSGDAWRVFPKAVCATWPSDFDKMSEGQFWYVIKDAPFDITQLKVKRRYEITKGVRNFSVSVVDNVDAVKDQLYNVYNESLKGYAGEVLNAISEERFYMFCKALSGHNNLVFAARSRDTDKMCGYAHVPLYGDWAAFSALKTIPEYEKQGVNAALVAGILDHLAPYLAKEGFYFCDGSRTLFHQTAFQDYLEKYFQFRKAYCKLNVVYNPRLYFVLKALFPFRKILRPLSSNPQVRGLLALLEMENIVRTQNNKK